MRENSDRKDSEYGQSLRSAGGLRWVGIEKTLCGKLRNSRTEEVFCKKGVLGNFAKFTENTCARVSFLIKLQASAGNFIKKRL